jgi:hypothetical protein
MRLRMGCAVLAGLALAGAGTPGPARATEIDVGVYADVNGTGRARTAAPYEQFWLYLVIEHPVAELPEVLGHRMQFSAFRLRLQCLLEIPANLWILNFDSSLGGLCGGFGHDTDPDIDTTYSDDTLYMPPGTPCQNRRCLLRIGLMPLDDAPAPIHLRPGSAGGAVNGLPRLDYTFFRLNHGQNESFTGVLGLRPLPAGVDSPVFVVNGGLVPVEAATWGAVKSLYR